MNDTVNMIYTLFKTDPYHEKSIHQHLLRILSQREITQFRLIAFSLHIILNLLLNLGLRLNGSLLLEAFAAGTVALAPGLQFGAPKTLGPSAGE